MGRASGRRLRRQRAILMQAQGGLCAGCGRRMVADAPPNSPLYPTVDHVIPHSRGGGSGYRNIVLKHGACNRKRADRPPTAIEFNWLRHNQRRLAGASPKPARPRRQPAARPAHPPDFPRGFLERLFALIGRAFGL